MDQENIQTEYNTKDLRDYIYAITRHKYLVLISAALIFLLALILAFGLSPVYRSSATILIEQQEIPQDLVRSTITSYADQRIQLIRQRVMTVENLWGIVKKYDLYKKERQKQPREVIIEEMRDDVSMDMISADVVDPRSGRPIQATIAFKLAYENNSPQLAQKVANELMTLFLNENLKNRTQMVEDTSLFLSEEVRRLETDISDLETKLAKFKKANVNRLPELAQLNMTLMDRTERELFEVDREIRSLEERKIYLNSELLQISPSATVISETGERVLGPGGRLKILEAEYVKLSSTYSDTHPDIRRLKKEIEALRAETGQNNNTETISKQLFAMEGELAVAKEKYSPEHPDVMRLQKAVDELKASYVEAKKQEPAEDKFSKDVRSDNPAYIQLATQLEATESEIASLRNKRKQLRNKLSDLEQRLVETPQIEREYKALTRNYDNAVLKYREIKAKQMEAQLAQSLESERKGERFTLIEPPLLSEKPVKPNRLAILVLGMVLAAAGSIGLAFLVDALDGKLHGRKNLQSFFGEAPLAVIPYILTEKEILKRNRYLKVAAISTACGVFVVAILFHLLIMPIDTFWYVLMRRLGV